MPRLISRRILIAAALTATVGLGVALSNRKIIRLLQSRLASPPIKPPIVSRAGWNARSPDHEAPNEQGFALSATDPAWYAYPADLTQIYNTVAIHHSASLLASNETMLDIQNLHMNANGWADVGYHYAVDKDGIIYEGRDIGVRGASVAGYNTGTIGVVLMGNFEVDSPIDVQLSALQSLVNWLTYTYLLTHLAAHREFNPESLCPGANILPYLDTLAQTAGLQRGTDGHVPPI